MSEKTVRGIIVSSSASLRHICDQVDQFANVDISVLILGESGSGKEVFAKRIHERSDRSAKKFVKVNCAALPGELLESELFGYEAGAFTGASRFKPGMFDLAQGGTIFLDEIGEMSPLLQAKLLHVLQDGQFVRLGGRQKVNTDVRILAATNIDITTAMRAKSFREDLYYRLASVVIHIPPLRDRRDDVLPLLTHFLEIYCAQYGMPPLQLSAMLLEQLCNYHWPGNVRELENFAKRLAILRDESVIFRELQFAEPVRRVGPSPAETPTQDLKSTVRGLREGAESRAIAAALESTHWNRKAAALQLNISYKAILYKIRQYGLDRNYAAIARIPTQRPAGLAIAAGE